LLYNACSLATGQKEGSRKEFERANLITVDKGLGKKLIFSVVTNMQNFHSRSDYQ
jgi:hypothetical protein